MGAGRKDRPTTGFKYTTDGQGTATIVGYDQSVASSTSGDVVIPYFIKGANSYGEMNYHVTQFGDGQNPVFENAYINGKISFEASDRTEITIKANSFQQRLMATSTFLSLVILQLRTKSMLLVLM